MLYINGGTGAGQFVRITDYKVIGLVKEVVVNTAFTTTLDATSTYQIYPAVQVVGDDNVTVNCEARALINAFSSNSVYNIDVLQRGKGYRLATATVLSDVSVGVTNNAVLEVIIPPPGGHGYDVYNELGGTVLGISLTFSNTENSTIPTQNDYRTVGIVKNPLFANVQLNLVNSDDNPGTNGSFIIGEEIYQIRPIYLSGTVSVNQASITVVGTGTDFENQFKTGDFIYINGGRNVYIGQIAGVSNSTSLTISSNSLFTNTAANFALVSMIGNGVIQSTTPSTINITNAASTLADDNIIVGATTFTTANVVSYLINDISKSFNTFVQLRKYVGQLESGTFISDELVYQGALAITNASFHSINVVSNTISNLFVANQDGLFAVGNTIQGSNSGAIFTISSEFPGDLVLDSGEVVYLENNPPVPRSDQQAEIVKILLLLT